MKLFHRLWNDEAGLVVSSELVFVTSIAAIGMIVGLSAARDGITSELADVGDAVTEYNQGYQVASIQGHGAAVAGSQYLDGTDFCDVADGVAIKDEGCILRANDATLDEVDTIAPTIPN